MRNHPSFLSSRQIVEEPTINLTPLIDVVFVILIMFIVIAPLLELDRVELADSAPVTAHASQGVQATSAIAIHVHRDNTIFLNQQPIKHEQLVAALMQTKQQFPQAVPQLFHDRQAHFGTYQSVKNAAEQAGFTQLEVILNPN